MIDTSYWPPDPSAVPLELSLGDLLRQAVAEVPDRTLLICDGADGRHIRWTYREVLDRSEQVASALLQHFEPGERLAVWAPNCPEWQLLEYGAALAGITVVTVNPAFRSAEVRHVLGQSRAAGVVLVDSYRDNDMSATLKEIQPDLPELRTVIRLEEWDSFIQSAHAGRELPAVSPHTTLMIQYTSGTTGFPKGAQLPHRSCVNNGDQLVTRLTIPHGSVWLGPLPLFHVGGSVVYAVGVLCARATHVLMPAFDPDAALDLIERERAEFIAAVPTMLLAMLEKQEQRARDLSSLRTVCSGGASVPPEIVRRVQDGLGVAYAPMYGLTEGCSLVTATGIDADVQDKANTVGWPLPLTGVKIIDTGTGDTAALGTVGEVCIDGPGVMHGYFDLPEQTAEAIDPDGWLHTGDLGSMDERGHLRIAGRLKEMIIRGGENIYPAEVEAVLHEHPAVADVAVVGVPDERWGELVVAYVRLAPDRPATGTELAEYLKTRVARHKVPAHWRFVDQFPMTPSGKVQKFQLARRFTDENGEGADQ